jgi:DNA-binding HxlR family transcriptional regulator
LKRYDSPVRTYGQNCTVARTLDLVGGRWSLLIVRELLLGPRRFGELAEGLPGIATNLLAERLRELESGGLLRRAGGSYELTATGEALEPAMFALAVFGLEHVPPSESAPPISPSSALLMAKGLRAAHAPAELPGGAQVELDGEVFELRVADGRLQARRGSALSPAAVLRASTRVFLGLVTGRLSRSAALASGGLAMEGDAPARRALLDLLSGRASAANAAR